MLDRSFLCGPLPPAQKSIVLALAGWADLTLSCYPTKEQLAASSGVGLRQLWDHMQALKAAGYINWQMVRIRGQHRNVYQLLPACGVKVRRAARQAAGSVCASDSTTALTLLALPLR